MDESVLQVFAPELMMLRGELTKARRLLRKLDRINDAYHRDKALPKAEQKGYEAFSKFRTPIWAEMDVLAATVWKREVGLERYTVLHVRRDDMAYRFQVLSFSFQDGQSWGNRWMWQLNGRALRKDGTLGCNTKGIGFRHASLERRYLDGSWRELRWLGEVTG